MYCEDDEDLTNNEKDYSTILVTDVKQFIRDLKERLIEGYKYYDPNTGLHTSFDSFALDVISGLAGEKLQ